jgi:hypothetical protein
MLQNLHAQACYAAARDGCGAESIFGRCC